MSEQDLPVSVIGDFSAISERIAQVRRCDAVSIDKIAATLEKECRAIEVHKKPLVQVEVEFE